MPRKRAPPRAGAPPPTGGTGAAAAEEEKEKEKEKDQSPDEAKATPRPQPRRARGRRRPATSPSTPAAATVSPSPSQWGLVRADALDRPRFSADEIEEDARQTHAVQRQRDVSPSARTPVEKRRRAGSGMPRKRARHDNHGDLISGLPDDILATIISLLPTREGGKTQLLARSWRPLWRYAPVNICCDRPICSKQYKRISVISDLLSIHRGTTRRFNLDPIRFRTDKEKEDLESWFSSRSFAKLEELIIGFADSKYQLPSSVLLCTSALVVAKISRCVFPKEVTDLPSFPLLKELSLCSVYIAEDVFHGLLSRCHVLESLYLERLNDMDCFTIKSKTQPSFPLLKKLSLCCVYMAPDVFHGLLSGCHVLESLYLEGLNNTGSFEISSETLTSVGLCNCILKQGELIIKYAPRLERLLLPRPGRGDYILRVIEAPKLQILGLLSPCISELEIANISFKSLAPASFKNTMTTVKILALEFSVADLDATIGVLRCFPCIEKLYVNFMKWLDIPVKKHVHPTDPVKCPEINLKVKELVLNNYEGSEQDVCFAKFFLLNSRVLKKIRLGIIQKIYVLKNCFPVTKEWKDHRDMLLEVRTSASPHVQVEVEFVASIPGANFMELDALDLSTADPFASSYSQLE